MAATQLFACICVACHVATCMHQSHVRADAPPDGTAHQLFYDLVLSSPLQLREDSQQHARYSQTIELIVKLGFYSCEPRDIKTLKDFVSLGDTVRATGLLDGQPDPVKGYSLQVTRLEVLLSWRQAHPCSQFVPSEEALALLFSGPPSAREHGSLAEATAAGAEQLGGQDEATAAVAAEGAAAMGATRGGAGAHGGAQRGHPRHARLGEPGEGHVHAEAACLEEGEAVAAEPRGDSQQQQQQQQHPQQQHQQQSQQQHPQQQVVCKFFINTGRCAKGDRCPFLHPETERVDGNDVPSVTGLQQLRRSWLKDRREGRRARAAAAGFRVHEGSSAAEKRQRAVVLARWLLQTFGKELLCSGSGVLDVAGGRGALTFELQARHGVPCTLVEPRPFKLSKAQQRFLDAQRQQAALNRQGQLQGQRQRAQEESEAPVLVGAGRDEDDGLFDASGLFAVVAGARDHGDASGSEEDGEDGEEDGEGGDAEEEAAEEVEGRGASGGFTCSSAGDVGGAGGGDRGGGAASCSPRLTMHPGGFRQVQARFTLELWRRREGSCSGGAASDLGGGEGGGGDSVWRHLANCSVVVGLHPDQATDAILRFALEHGKPFAIVPCCVFPTLFPHRAISGEAAAAAAAAALPRPEPTGEQRVQGAGATGACEQQQAGSEQQQAGSEQQRAGSERQQAGSERQQAGGEQQQAGSEQQRAGSERRPPDSGGPDSGGPDSGGPAGQASGFGSQGLEQSGALVAPNASSPASSELASLQHPVVTYHELVQYLVEQGGPGTRVACVPFRGANYVVLRGAPEAHQTLDSAAG